ncbi:calcineurin-like phosphoesterase [Capsaspora owczarzaki ATCC 30864]|uniref:Purple acid phosphatase n=1 Tax=Capsaspora owczarzaki (strain ATCC 30864) TaxID=595528 RepID=A0A0D2X4M8_CAPO3|nr:calcineurin-like phosphoesterase [Capsaspora owczarzaki ATCC 30864]KJE96334.1 calcineurin-like phosphoesterase [Capsaspora owczarzaki ATCC 30864]|eukprot:XP_004344296.1 calcineurin-like phosphoesterase [Capsaspora owczarzaki ATCC 30864]
MRWTIAAAVLALLVALVSAAPFRLSSNPPEQIRLSFTGIPTEAVMMWITPSPASPQVKVGPRSGAYYIPFNGTSTQYTYDSYTSGYIHTVKVTGLTPLTTYFYVVGDASQGWSNEFTFKSMTTDKVPLTVAVIGDLGFTSNSLNTVNGILSDSMRADVLWHAGDITYANGNQPIWDQWGNMVQPLSASMAWMVGVGNHENYHNFTAYNYRFRMPYAESNSPGLNLFWSYSHSYVRLVLLSTETDFSVGSAQYNWFIKEMESVNRTQTPWLILMYHRPFYNSNTAHQGEIPAFQTIYEPLFYKYKVDLAFNGHVHSYERSKQVYRNVVSTANPTEYIVIGDGGNQEGLASQWLSQPSWSAFRQAAYGYGRMVIHNETHIDWTWHINPTTNEYTIRDQATFVRPYPRF